MYEYSPSEDEDLLREYVCDYLEDIGFVTLRRITEGGDWS